MPDEPDYFDRLLARQLPADAVPGRVRLRPRLPGPFERAEGRWTEIVEEDTLPPLPVPVSPAPAPVPPAVTSAARPRPLVPDPSLLAAPRADPPVPDARPAGPPLRPAADVSPPPMAAPPSPRLRPDPSPEQVSPARDDGTAPPSRPSPAPEPPNGPAGLLRTAPARIIPPASPRRAEPPVSRTREEAPPEQPSVQVRIGRLEVRTAEPERRRPSPVNGGRRAPAVDLSGYLSGRDSGAAS